MHIIQYCITDLKSAQAVIKLMLKHDPDLKSIIISREALREIRKEVYKLGSFRGNRNQDNSWAYSLLRQGVIVPVTYIDGVMVYGKG